MTRGTLRIYLGAAPGVGKTYAMLNEGRRRHLRGTDVVVAWVETHGRALTAEQVGDLEVLPPAQLNSGGGSLEEMDLEGVIARRPSVALVDDLAHTNVVGSRNSKRWEDVEELLTAGIDVISTVNIDHLESIKDVVEEITGVAQLETVPDQFVRAAGQIELVDMAPEALRRRMAHGNIFAADEVDAALTNYFREGNLSALRELALLWVADQVDIGLAVYRQRHGIEDHWETRERVVVSITGAPGTERLIRRAARVAQRAHGQLLGVHVLSRQSTSGAQGDSLTLHRRLLEEVGGEYHEIAGEDVAAALIAFARSENATRIILGSSRLSRLQEMTRGSIINRVIRLSGPIDVHVISHEDHEQPVSIPRSASSRTYIAPRRLLLAWGLTFAGLPLVTAVLSQHRESLGLPTVITIYLLFVVIDAAIGGLFPALFAAVGGFLLVNWFFTPPLHRWTVAEGENVLALIVYLLTAAIVSGLMAAATQRRLEAVRAAAEARTLAALAARMASPDPLPSLMSHLRRTFAMNGVTLLRRVDAAWIVEVSDGEPVSNPRDADNTHSIADSLILATKGGDLAADDLMVLDAFSANLAVALEQRELNDRARRAVALDEANSLREALLQAVSHDLRSPLAAIKASVNSLRLTDVEWHPSERSEFLATIEDETDRLTALVENLLDMSRINADHVAPMLRWTTLEEAVPAALADLGQRAKGVVVDLPETLPAVRADPTLLERVVVNLVDNAVAYGDDENGVRVEVGVIAGRVLLRVIDRGPGIPQVDRERVFLPFQRLGDTTPRRGAGMGLGLAVARGFVRVMGGELTIEDTPGGGTTMVVELEASESPSGTPS